MGLVTVQGIVHDPNGTFPTSGTVDFILSDWYCGADGHLILPKSETATINAGDGVFSISLESTLDGSPASRGYQVQAAAVIETVSITTDLGSIQLAVTPTTQQLCDLLVVAAIPAATGTLIWNETPAGTINDVNKVFTLSKTPAAGTERVYVSGQRQLGGGIDYTLAGATITFVVPPLTGQWIRSDYTQA